MGNFLDKKALHLCTHIYCCYFAFEGYTFADCTRTGENTGGSIIRVGRELYLLCGTGGSSCLLLTRIAFLLFLAELLHTAAQCLLHEIPLLYATFHHTLNHILHFGAGSRDCQQATGHRVGIKHYRQRPYLFAVTLRSLHSY